MKYCRNRRDSGYLVFVEIKVLKQESIIIGNCWKTAVTEYKHIIEISTTIDLKTHRRHIKVKNSGEKKAEVS